nr:MAG TPA: hypothetical protein [Caudoviricetes sp.]
MFSPNISKKTCIIVYFINFLYISSCCFLISLTFTLLDKKPASINASITSNINSFKSFSFKYSSILSKALSIFISFSFSPFSTNIAKLPTVISPIQLAIGIPLIFSISSTLRALNLKFT